MTDNQSRAARIEAAVDDVLEGWTTQSIDSPFCRVEKRYLKALAEARDAPADPQPTANPIRVQVQHVAEVLRELREEIAATDFAFIAQNSVRKDRVLEAVDRAAAKVTSEPPVPAEIDFDKVICPSCCHTFQATPVNVQRELNALRDMDEKAPSDDGKLRRLRKWMTTNVALASAPNRIWIAVGEIDRLLAEPASEPTPKPAENCETCRFSQPIVEACGRVYCHRNPRLPMSVIDITGPAWTSAYPEHRTDDWCGEWRSK